MTTAHIILKFTLLVRSERKITNEVLLYINLIEDRQIHLELGYPSMYEFLTKKFGYSSGAAQRRIEAARQLRAVPGISAKLESGELSLTNVARARQAMRQHEKMTGRKLSNEEQAEVLSHMENKTSAEAEQRLFSFFPETAEVRAESRRRVSEMLTRLCMNMTDDAMADLEWVRNFLSHSIPDLEDGKIFARLLKEFRRREEKKDERAVQREKAARAQPTEPPNPTTQPIIGAEDHRVKTSKSRVRRVTFKLANRRCEYRHPQTGKICGSAVWIESDHIEPKALGGTDELENRRCLCGAHNRYEAQRKLRNLYSYRAR